MDHPSVWTGPLSWRQLIWWKQNTLVAVGWDTMTQKDIVCELEILTENDNSKIVIRFELPFLFPLICCSCRCFNHNNKNNDV